MIHRRTLLKTGLSVTAAATVMPLWSGAHAQAAGIDIAAAKAEGVVNYYASTTPEVSQAMVNKFNQTYPTIKVNIVRLATGPLSQRYAAEMESGNVVADILQMGDPLVLEDGYAKGWFAKLSDLPAVKAWPAEFRTDFSVVVSVFPDTVTYSTAKVKGADIPQTWLDILKPKWKNQILMADPRNTPQTVAWALLMQDTYGKDFISKLKDQNPKFVSSTIPGTQMLAAGESSILLPNLRVVTFPLMQKGAPVDDSTPTPATGWGSSLGISAKSHSPNAARLFTSFILSMDAQLILSKDVAASPLGNIPGALTLAKDFQLADIRTAVQKTPEVLKMLGIG
jgi:iron(III) transport system substrate-binding protein